MKICLALLSPFFTTTTVAMSDAGLARLGLTPRPKQVSVSGGAPLCGPVGLAGVDAFPSCAAWLREIVEREIGTLANDSPGEARCHIELTRAELPHGPEAFRLRIADGSIRLVAPGEAGMFRALGRLARMLDSAASRHEGGVVRCPAVEIDDWPDTPRSPRTVSSSPRTDSRVCAATRSCVVICRRAAACRFSLFPFLPDPSRPVRTWVAGGTAWSCC